MRNRKRCRMHGGVRSIGAPSGSANGRYRTGRYTQEMQELRQRVARLLREAGELV